MAVQFSYFSKNGQILPVEQAQIPLNNIAYSYGFGVYETLKVRNGIIYFVKQHLERLQKSAEIIGLEHQFAPQAIEQYLTELLQKLTLTNEKSSCNLKLLLIGGKDPQLFILALAPLFPNRKLYKEGARTITIAYERLYPQAKTLNMLSSYLAYKKAKEEGCYEALFVDQKGAIREGTRTNLFAMKGKTLITHPQKEVLDGVTRQTVIAVAKEQGFEIREEQILQDAVQTYDGFFLTSTSSKIIPIRQIDETELPIGEKIHELIKAYDTFLKQSNGVFV